MTNPTRVDIRKVDSRAARITIRRANTHDAPQIVTGIEAICAEGIYFVTDRFLPDAQWEATLCRPETVPDHLLTIAEVEGAFAGCGNLFPGPQGRKDRHVTNLGLYVLKPFRRQGVGACIMAWMLDWAQSTAFEKITLSVLATNQPAIYLYQKFGFKVEGVRHRQYLVGSNYVDSLLMAKFLGET